MMLMPSIKLRVARSHSAKMSTPLVGSASMAFASSGRFFYVLAGSFFAENFVTPLPRAGRRSGDRDFDRRCSPAHSRFSSILPPTFRDDFLSTSEIGKPGHLRKSHKVRFLRQPFFPEV
jgi:hypothetical protein